MKFMQSNTSKDVKYEILAIFQGKEVQLNTTFTRKRTESLKIGIVLHEKLCHGIPKLRVEIRMCLIATVFVKRWRMWYFNNLCWCLIA